jgi:hypothetical protein
MGLFVASMIYVFAGGRPRGSLALLLSSWLLMLLGLRAGYYRRWKGRDRPR